MPFKEISTLSKEAYITSQVESLKSIYKKAQLNLTRELQKVDLTDFQRYRSEALLAQVKGITADLNKQAYQWSKKTLPLAYNNGIDMAGDRLKELGVTRFISYDARVHTSAINALIDDVTIDLITANEGMKKFFNRVILQTQQRLLEDSQISKMIAEGIIQGQARRTVSDTILKDLRAKMGDEKYIVINGRNYRPDKYAELVARTRTREASTQGNINTALRYGVDLVQWDAHAEVCPICQQYSGRVFSISGADDDFPMLTEKPPLHPNCKCVINPITKQNLISRGYYDEIVKLSNDPTEEVTSFAEFEKIVKGL